MNVLEGKNIPLAVPKYLLNWHKERKYAHKVVSMFSKEIQKEVYAAVEEGEYVGFTTNARGIPGGYEREVNRVNYSIAIEPKDRSYCDYQIKPIREMFYEQYNVEDLKMFAGYVEKNRSKANYEKPLLNTFQMLLKQYSLITIMAFLREEVILTLPESYYYNKALEYLESYKTKFKYSKWKALKEAKRHTGGTTCDYRILLTVNGGKVSFSTNAATDIISFTVDKIVKLIYRRNQKVMVHNTPEEICSEDKSLNFPCMRFNQKFIKYKGKYKVEVRYSTNADILGNIEELKKSVLDPKYENFSAAGDRIAEYFKSYAENHFGLENIPPSSDWLFKNNYMGNIVKTKSVGYAKMHLNNKLQDKVSKYKYLIALNKEPHELSHEDYEAWEELFNGSFHESFVIPAYCNPFRRFLAGQEAYVWKAIREGKEIPEEVKNRFPRITGQLYNAWETPSEEWVNHAYVYEKTDEYIYWDYPNGKQADPINIKVAQEEGKDLMEVIMSRAKAEHAKIIRNMIQFDMHISLEVLKEYKHIMQEFSTPGMNIKPGDVITVKRYKEVEIVQMDYMGIVFKPINEGGLHIAEYEEFKKLLKTLPKETVSIPLPLLNLVDADRTHEKIKVYEIESGQLSFFKI